MTRTAAVVGAGVTGLIVARALRAVGIRPVVFERARDIGGLWSYSDSSDEGVMYQSLRTNLPKEIMQVADFPYATSIPSFPSHTDVLAYIRRFADAFQLRDHVQFRTVVTKVDPVPFEKTEATAHAPGLPGLRTRWRVTTAPAGSENVNSDGTCKTSVSESDSAAADGGHGSRVIESNGSDAAATTAMYDFLIVCNGHYDVPQLAELPGREHFRGEVLHSACYRTADRFAGQRVCVVGVGPSGIDIALELSGIAATTTLVARTDEAFSPLGVRRDSVARRVGLSGVDEAGRITFADGGPAVVADVLLFCTGYRYAYPFLEGRPTRTGPGETHSTSLAGLPFRSGDHVAPVVSQLLHAAAPSLAFVGLPQRVNPVPVAEAQADLLARLYSGRLSEAGLEELRSRCADELSLFASAGREGCPSVGRSPHVLGAAQWDYMRYLDSLGQLGEVEGATGGVGGAGGGDSEDAESELRLPPGALYTVSPARAKLRSDMYADACAVYCDVSAARARDPATYRSREYRWTSEAAAAACGDGGAAATALLHSGAAEVEDHGTWVVVT